MTTLGSGKPHSGHYPLPAPSPSAAQSRTRFILPFVCWAKPCQGRVGMAVQLPQSSSLPLLASFPQASSHKAAQATGLAEASGCQKAGVSQAAGLGILTQSRGFLCWLKLGQLRKMFCCCCCSLFVCFFVSLVLFSLAGVSLYGQVGLELLIIVP